MGVEIRESDREIIRVLLIEDDPDDVLLLRQMLAEVEDNRFDLECADRLQAGLDRLAQGGIHVVLLDLSLPDSQGLDTLVTVHARALGVPLVVLAGLDDEMLAVEAVREGAQDYLVKGQIDSNLLVRSIRYAIERNGLLEELKRAQQKQLKMKNQFLSHISHELRSPLTAIRQFVTILLDGLAGNLSPEQREYLEIALRNSNQLRAMIDELLDVTRAETGKLSVEPQRISLVKLVVETFETLQASATAKGIKLSSSLPNDLPSAYADPYRVRQILVNLIENGNKHTQERGKITVRVQVSNEDPHFLQVDVVDTGCGISPEKIERIFKPLYQIENTTKAARKGLGLGLYICKDLISRQGGRIWVESQLERGSTFFFTLPIFSLVDLLSPVLTPENLEKGSVAIISARVFPVEKLPSSKTDEKVLRKARDVVQRSILPNLDVLLPRITSADSEEIFFVVACCDRRGAEVLVRRIQGQLARLENIQSTGLDAVVSFTMVDIPSTGNSKSLEQLVQEVGSNIEDVMDSLLKKEEVFK